MLSIQKISYLISLLFLIITLNGCGSVIYYEPENLKSLKKSQIATLSCPLQVFVHKIDGKSPGPAYESIFAYNVERQRACKILLEEGRHSMVVQLDRRGHKGQYSSEKMLFEFEVEGGKQYNFYAEIDGDAEKWWLVVRDIDTEEIAPWRFTKPE